MIRRFECISPPDWWTEIDTKNNLFRTEALHGWEFCYPDQLNAYINHAAWKEVAYGGYDPNDLQSGSKPCCGGGVGTAATYASGKWHDNQCDSLKAPQLPPPTTTVNPYAWVPSSPKKGKCTCGSTAVGSDRHSDWCDAK